MSNHFTGCPPRACLDGSQLQTSPTARVQSPIFKNQAKPPSQVLTFMMKLTALLLLLTILATVCPGIKGVAHGYPGAHLRHLQEDDQQPEQPEQPEQPPEQPVIQPVMQQPGMSMGISNMGGGYMPGDNTNTMGGTNEIMIGRCIRGSWTWPSCCVPSSPEYPRCTRYM